MATSALMLAVALLVAPNEDARVLPVRTAVAVERTGVLLGDIVDVTPLPPQLRMRAAALPVATFKPGQRLMTFQSSSLYERARALMPALAPWLSQKSAALISVELVLPSPRVDAPSPRPAASKCIKVGRVLRTGEAPASTDFSPAACGEALVATALRYDPTTQTLRTRRELQPGDVIAAVPTFALPDVAPGQRVRLRSRIGPVQVEREVLALQPAGPGQSLFVRGADGEVFSATFAEIAR